MRPSRPMNGVSGAGTRADTTGGLVIRERFYGIRPGVRDLRSNRRS
jgi:hypothetical protein